MKKSISELEVDHEPDFSMKVDCVSYVDLFELVGFFWCFFFFFFGGLVGVLVVFLFFVFSSRIRYRQCLRGGEKKPLRVSCSIEFAYLPVYVG